MSTLISKISGYRNSDTWGLYVGAGIGVVLVGVIALLYRAYPDWTLRIGLLLVNEIGGIVCGALIAAGLFLAQITEKDDRDGIVLSGQLLCGGIVALTISLAAGIAMLRI